MTQGADGYVSEIGYAFAYHPELNPLRARLALLNAGWAPPRVQGACELGYGQGLAVNIHAAAGEVSWRGTDAMPEHAAFARGLAQAIGADLDGQTFEAFCAREDLPDFDFIGLHGVWSWISEANARVIVDFIGRRLRPGGVVYVSYNALPGAAAMAPLRRLLAAHAEAAGDGSMGGPIGGRIDAAFDFAGRVLEATPRYAARPEALERVAALRGRGHGYLAHEYFNRDWRPMDVAELGAALAPAGLSYACPAGLLDHVDALNLTPAQRALLQGLDDPMLRETARDFMLGQQFRRDYWIRGLGRLNDEARATALREVRLVLTRPRDQVGLSVTGALGEATLSGALYDPILDILADGVGADGAARSIGEIELGLEGSGVGLAHIVQAVVVLAGKGDIAPAQAAPVVAAAEPAARRLNATILARARTDGDIQTLASPVTGGGVAVDRVEQLFLLARAEGRGPEAWAAHARAVLGDETLEIEARAEAFAQARLPLLEGLGVA